MIIAHLVYWYEYYKNWLHRFDLSENTIALLYNIVVVTLMLIFVVLSYKAGKWIMYKFAGFIGKKKKGSEPSKQVEIIEALDKNKFFSYLGYYFPLLIIRYNLKIILPRSEVVHNLLENAYSLFVVILTLLVINSLLNSFIDLNQYKSENRSKPIKGLVQFVQLILYFFGFVICICVIFDKELTTVLGGLGAASAVLMLIFRDSITGVVAGVQLSFNKMIEIGDRITLQKYDVDGVVVDITLTSVKVRNWDNSISTVPSYNLVISDSVKNWQEMYKVGGRQIARSVNVDMMTIKPCTSEMMARYQTNPLAKRGIEDILTLGQQNTHQSENKDIVSANLLDDYTNITNLAIFRAYLYEYLMRKKGINPSLDLVVRLKPPTPQGMPIEVYCFADVLTMKPYETLQAEIFEHIISMMPFFDLSVFQVRQYADF